MIKDCLEDLLMLIHSNRKNPRPNNFIDKGSNGYPTVEEIMKLSDVYYGPPKVVVSSLGSL